jgi:hypothetical protein
MDWRLEDQIADCDLENIIRQFRVDCGRLAQHDSAVTDFPVPLGVTLRGVGFGARMWSMVGMGLRHSRIDQYQSAIKSGQLLMMIDVPRDRVEEIEGLATGHHPAAELEGTDPNIPIFP